LAGVLIAPRFNTLSAQDFFALVVVAVAAAAVGRLISLPGALIGGLGLGVLIAEVDTFLPRWSDTNAFLKSIEANITPAMPFVVLFGVLVLWPAIRGAAEVRDPLSGVEPPPPALAALSRSRALTIATRVFGVVFLTTVFAVVLAQNDPKWISLVGKSVILATIFLSITVITGYAGSISLCQGTFAAIGAFGVFQLVDRFDMSALGAALVGAVIAGLVGALLSLPVLRLGGVWVAIATLAFAFFFDAVMIKLSWVGGGDTSLLQGTRVPRPTLGPWDLADDRYFLVLALVVFVIVAIAVILIREGSTGRTLRALRGSPLAAQSIGISPARARFTAFAVSGFIAGLGGALLAMENGNVNYPSNFSPFVTLFWVVLVVSLGSRTVEGAAQAGAAFYLFDAVILSGTFLAWIFRTPDAADWLFFPISGQWRFILFGLSAMQFAKHPEGLVENGKRQAHARIEKMLAKRRGPELAAAGPQAGTAADTPIDEPVS
jgi:ABC-type branched-subunit amino acid transport system permease subunit